MEAGAPGGWARCVCSQEAGGDERWCSALFLLLIQFRVRYRKWCLLVYAGSSYLVILIKNAYTDMPAGSFTRWF